MINKIFKVMIISLVCFVMCLAMTACLKDNKKPAENIVDDVEAAPKEKKPVIAPEPDKTNEAKGVTLGKISGNTYSNDYFGFEFTFPDNWEKVYLEEDIMTLAKRMAKLEITDDIDLTEQDWLVLFMAMQYELDDEREEREFGTGTSAITVSADKIGNWGIETIEQCFEEMDSDNPANDFDFVHSDIQDVKLGSKEAKYMDRHTSNNIIRDRDYVCEVNGYFVYIHARNCYGEATDDIEQFINSINFK